MISGPTSPTFFGSPGLRQSLQQLQAPWPAADGMERSAHSDDVRRALGDATRVG